MNYGPFAQQWGATGSDGRLAIFPDQATGFAAMSGLLDTYQNKHGLNTVSGIINRWAPPNVDNNSTSAYISTVARKIGVDPNSPLSPEHRAPLMEAMASYEAGRPVSMSGSPPAAAPPAPSPQPYLGTTPMAEPQPSGGFLENLSRGFANPLTQGGLGLMLASAQGGNMAEGLFGGVKSGLSAQQAMEAQLRRQQQQMMLKRMASDPNFAKSAGIPPELMQLAVAGEDPGMVAKFIASKPDRDLQRQHLDLQNQQMQQQASQHAQMFPYQRDLLAAQAKAAVAKDPEQQAKAAIWGQVLQEMQGGQKPSPQQQMPQLQPQSFDGGQQPAMLFPASDAAGPQTPVDPNLIRVGSGMQPGGQDKVDTPLGTMQRSLAEKFQLLMSKDPGSVIGKSLEKSEMGTTAKNNLEEQLINRVSDLGELNNIAAKYKPEYLGLQGKMKAGVASWADWISSDSVPTEDKQYLRDYTRFAASTTERFNNRIKALSGTAVSGAEATRMDQANPNMKDSPSQFKAKLDEQMQMQKMAVARYNWLRNVKGLDTQSIAKAAKDGTIETLAGIDDMRNVYDQRAQQIEGILRQSNPQAPPEALRNATKQRLKQEFGI